MNITLDQAEKAIKAAKAKAAKLKVAMNIAVVDSGANLIAFAHMDDAWLGSIDISMRKARTARYFNMNSGEIGKRSPAVRFIISNIRTAALSPSPAAS